MCEEACPVDAIELTSLFDLTGRSREEMIFDKEKLLSVYDQTKDAEPMKSAAAGRHAMNQLLTIVLAATVLLAAGHVADAAARPAVGPRAGHAVDRSSALGLLASQIAPPRRTGRDDRVLDPGRGHRAVGRGHRHAFAARSTGHLVRAVAAGHRGLVPVRGAQFLGVATIVVYAGAILVTFLFVLMLAQPRGPCLLRPRELGGAGLGRATGAVMVGILTIGDRRRVRRIADRPTAEQPRRVDHRREVPQRQTRSLERASRGPSRRRSSSAGT